MISIYLLFSFACALHGAVDDNQALFPIEKTALASIRLEGFPDWLEIGFGSLWVSNAGLGGVQRIDPDTNKVVALVKVNQPCAAMAAGIGSLWVASRKDKAIYRIDAHNNKVTATIPVTVADSEGSIAAGQGGVWVLTDQKGILTRIDAVTNEVIANISVKPYSYAAAAGYGAIWVTNTGRPRSTENGSVQRIDPKTNTVVATIAVHSQPRFLAVGEGAVWVLNQTGGTVSRIDPVTNEVVASIEVGVPGPGGDIAAGEGAVWVRAAKVLLSVIDPKTNKVKMRFGPAQGSGAVRAGDGKVWVSAHDVNKIWSINPATEVGAAENSGNAALQYWLAFALCPPEKAIGSATTDDEEVGYGVPVGAQLAKFFQGDGERALVHLHRGAKSSVCDWATDLRKDGPRVAAPYGQKAHELARLALLRTRWRFEHGDWDGGIDDLIATMMLGRHIGRGKIWHNVHFGCMLEAMATGTAAFYLPRMPETARQRLTRDLGLLPPPTSMREVVLHYEENAFDWAIDNFERAEKEGRLLELVASISGKENAKKALELAHDADGMIKFAQAGRQLAHQLADAMSLRPDKYDRLFKERFAHQLQANPVVVMLGPDYESARDEEATAYCRLAFLKTALDVLGHGKSALNDHFDPNGDGPFKYVDIDGGFELGSALIYVATGDHRIRMRFGVRQIFP